MRWVFLLGSPLVLLAILEGCSSSESEAPGPTGPVAGQTALDENSPDENLSDPAPEISDAGEGDAAWLAGGESGDAAAEEAGSSDASMENPAPAAVSPSADGPDAAETRNPDSDSGDEGPAAAAEEEEEGVEAPGSAPPEKEEPLLLLDDETPLLLDEGDEASSGPVADNSRCHVCHLNFMQEELVLTHAKANIGCADCHGDSDAHIADESWASGGNGTPPDTMYLKEKINPFCLTCHPQEEIDQRRQHRLVFAEDAEGVYCTDCHGDHLLDERKCKWK